MLRLEFILIGLVSVVLSGCGGSGSGGKKKGSNPGITSSKPMGSFSEVGDQTNLPAYPDYCESDKYSIDPKLKVGQTFKVDEKWLATSGEYIGNPKLVTVLSVNKQVNKVSTRSDFKLGNGLPAWLKMSCSQTSESGSLTINCDADDMSSNLKKAMDKSGESWTMSSCFVKWDDKRQSMRKVTFGEYKFANGKTVQAYKIVQTDSGILECMNNSNNNKGGTPTLEGKGVDTVIKIISADVPDIVEKFSCGSPAKIFSYRKVETDSGKILAHEKFEIQEGAF